MDWNFPNIYNWNTAFGASQVCPGKFAGSRHLHVGESLLCFLSDRTSPSLPSGKEMKGQMCMASLGNKAPEWMELTDFDGNYTVLSTYVLESFQTNKLGGKLLES